MSEYRFDDDEKVMSPEIETALRALGPPMPMGFVQLAKERFETLHARRRARQWMALTTALFLGTSALIWATVLNIGQVGAAAWSGLVGAVAVIRSIFKIWDHIPGYGIVFAIVSMMVVLLLGGMVSKLDNRAFSVK